ncbi:MAG: hypothetical protein HYZ83_08690 [Candidatus Omnitrophica bacterium]|nr:hypothetical protein [Candidatus Omnitrophota bacterium]
MLTVGIPKEIKSKEKRVGMTPSLVQKLTSWGIPVLVEKNAGAESGFSDAQYEKAGAAVIASHAGLFAKSDLIQKVKEPLAPEFKLLRKDQILFCFLHLASPSNCALVKALVHSGATALGFETLVVEGKVPVLKPMSEIAGSLAAIYAAYFCSVPIVFDGRVKYPADFFKTVELLAESYPDFPRSMRMPKTVIFGGGVAGLKAAQYGLKMGAHMTVVEKNEDRLEALQKQYQDEKRLCFVSPKELSDKHLEAAEVFIACVHHPGKRAEPVLDEERLGNVSQKLRKIMIDISIDQGGNFPESRPSSYEDPLYLDSYGNLRFAVANIPSLCGRGASEALEKAAFPYTLALAKNGRDAFKKIPELKNAINVDRGKVLIADIRKAHESK